MRQLLPNRAGFRARTYADILEHGVRGLELNCTPPTTMRSPNGHSWG
jgi:hypothetical protein